MSVEAFLDKNIFVYHLVDSEPAKHQVAERLVRSALGNGNACTSFQVVGMSERRLAQSPDPSRR